jgi:hypothetical protein
MKVQVQLLTVASWEVGFRPLSDHPFSSVRHNILKEAFFTPACWYASVSARQFSALSGALIGTMVTTVPFGLTTVHPNSFA